MTRLTSETETKMSKQAYFIVRATDVLLKTLNFNFMEIWNYENLQLWKYKIMKIYNYENLQLWKFIIMKI